jgi:hypothetical protein
MKATPPCGARRRGSLHQEETTMGETIVDTENDELVISEAMHALRERFGVGLTYSAFWSRLAAGEIPGRRQGRTWFVREADLPEIAEILGPVAYRPQGRGAARHRQEAVAV